MALLACHTLRHSFNVAEHKRLTQQKKTLGLFSSESASHLIRAQVRSLSLSPEGIAGIYFSAGTQSVALTVADW